MVEEPYSNREIDGMFKLVSEKMTNMSASQAAFQSDIRQASSRIEQSMADGFSGVHERQDIANGRTGKLEKWQSYVIGFCACLSLVIFSFLIPIIGSYISSGRL